MPTNTNYKKNWSTKIKDVFIELKNYKFYHSPFSDSKKDARFIGRKKIKQRIITILSDTKTKSGAYLITGFRGMGKTSMLRQAIHEYNRKLENQQGTAEKANIIPKEIISFLRLLVYICFFLFACFLFLDTKTTPSEGNNINIIIGFLFIYVILGIEKFSDDKTSKNIWITFKLIYISFILIFCVTFFIYPVKICNELNCFFIDIKNFSLLEFENFKLSYLIVRGVIGLVMAYLIIAISCAIKDLIYYYLKSYYIPEKKSDFSNYYKSIEINLAQDRITERDILKRLTNNLLEFWEANKLNFTNKVFDRKIYYPFTIIRDIITNNTNKTRKDYEFILEKLIRLNSRIIGELTSQNDVSINPNISTGVSYGLSRIAIPLGKISSKNEVFFPIASAKEIEDELISIFKSIEKLRDKHAKNKHVKNIPEFIFIVDELDKILPASNSSIEEKEYANPGLDFLHNLPGVSKIRRRQEAVAKLLANLKGFLNVVRAKFFFIGGREMFDADLADIADRDAFYSSVFNDVIYVESFLKDKVEARAGITQMVETYLCNMILKDFSEDKEDNENYTLRKLSEKIDQGEMLIDGNAGLCDKSSTDPSICLKKFKILSLLQNYIIYLTYRCNGTPKKLVALTEKTISTYDCLNYDKPAKFRDENLVLFHKNEASSSLGNIEEKTFLRFKFNFQYEIGLTADLYRPFIIVNSRHIKALGDKLLFSSAFIKDHILKFHPFGFSWRNLELIPEVILVNKEPNLRGFIEELISFLSLTYIRTTVSGIFQYKFYSKVSKELTYLSKTSDLSSAAFNFTLDESLQIKRHYKKKLIELREKYKNFQPVKGDNHFVHSVAFVQTILGDLYFYDKEFDEALLYYTESIQSLRLPKKIDSKLLTRHQFYIWLRNKLKLGLTLEKMRAYDSAISYYRTLILDSERFISALVDQPDKKLLNYKSPNAHRDIQMLSMPFIAYLGLIEKSRSDGITYANLYNTTLEFKNLIVEREDIHENADIKFEIDDFRRDFLFADYYNNVGSILFYKNCLFPKLYEESNFKQPFLPNNIITQLKEIGRKKSKLAKEKYDEFYLHDFHPSLSGFCYYWGAASYLTDYHLKEHYGTPLYKKQKNNVTKNVLSTVARYLLPENIDLINTNRFYYLANVISKLGDSILGSLTMEEMKIPSDKMNFLSLIAKVKNIDNRNQINEIIDYFELAGKDENGGVFSIECVLNVYKLASALYLRASRVYSHSFQLKKILYVIKDLISLNYDSFRKSETEFFNLLSFLGTSSNIANHDLKLYNVEKIAEEIFRNTSLNYSISNRPQILKYRDILGEEFDRDILYNGINNASDNREVVLIINAIKIKVESLHKKRFLKHKELMSSAFPAEKNPLISPYSSINNRFLRVLELKYRTEYFYHLLVEVLEMSWIIEKPLEKAEVNIGSFKSPDIDHLRHEIRTKYSYFGETSIFEIMTFLIRESLFCLREIVKMVNIYSPSYVISYSYLAEAHRRMGDWCVAYENIKYILQRKDELNISSKPEINAKIFKENIQNTLGKPAIVYLEGNNHYESAKQNFYKTIQMHTEGRKYKNNILKIYTLEDDYNDNLTHFSIALERLRVNTGSIRQRINQLNSKTKNSDLYKFKSYFPSIGDESESLTPDFMKYDEQEQLKLFLDFVSNKV